MYIIGIDFGTTNSTLAYTLAENKDPQNVDIAQFSIPQVSAPGGIIKEASMLPSFLYFPLQEEFNAKAVHLPWNSQQSYSVGIFAKERGGELPSRMIASAKSWLCHSGINRREKILPQHFDQEKMSPLESSAAILLHLREAWEHKMVDIPFKDQQILITVPASFDPSARQLVQEAAQIAGYPEVILLEEPQAAFYAWLHRQQDAWRSILKEGDTILVIDIGGGTTDFSLIGVVNDNGNLTLERQAVGSHLLLGGDNIDLALAYLAASKLEEKGHSLDEWQMQCLVQRCRDAKEQILSLNPPKKVDLTIMGRGSKLIGGSLTASLSQKEVLESILDGFFPKIGPEECSSNEKRSGIQQIGLPYAQDPRVTSQLAKFLSISASQDSDNADMQQFVIPTAILFNGGTLKSEALRNRLVDVLNSWAKQAGKEPVKVLPDPDFDHAVSCGAVNYGLARAGKGVRIKSGTSHSYFIGVEDAIPAVPGVQIPLKAVCVVPFGLEEGTELELANQEFALVLGEQATFRFFCCPSRQLQNGITPEMGTTVRNWKQSLTELHPIETFMKKSDGDSKTIQVKLKSRVTELGVLELWCEAPDGRTWRLEFDLRKTNS